MGQRTIINKRRIENPAYAKDAFSNYIKKICREGKGYSARTIAENLGVSYEYLRKIINKELPTNNRDYIIAICSQLRLGYEETNEALSLYGLPKLVSSAKVDLSQVRSDIEDELRRDNLLISLLKKGKEKKLLSIEEINESLSKYGYDKLRLSSKKSKNKKKAPSSNYLESPIDITVSVDELIYDKYQSLKHAYDLNRYFCNAKMYLKKGDVIHLLTASNNKYYLQKDISNSFSHICYNDINQTGEFELYFQKLKIEIDKERKKYSVILYDTKNYQSRIGADIINDKIHVFYEQFNYSVPELNEYYLLEYINNEYIFSVSYESQFMKLYLPKAEFESLYSTPLTSNTISEISYKNDKLISSIHDSNYKKMKIIVDKTIKGLKEREVFIRNLNYIADETEKDKVCLIYNLEKEFECESTDYEYYAKKRTVTLDSIYGEVTLSLSDLYRAYELGIDSKDDLIRIIFKYGTLEGVFNT